MLKDYFVKQGLKEVQIEEFIRKKFPEGDYSHMEIVRTPLGVKIIIYTSSPGRIIGKGGRTINEMTEALRVKFELENPQLDVKSVQEPYLDAKLVAKQIALAFQKGFNFKKIGNMMVKRVMDAGAIGVEIIISGRMSGSKGTTAKFNDGFLARSGDLAKKLVDYGYEDLYQIGRSKPGKVGIKVKIMREFETITGERKHSLADVKPKRQDELRLEAEKPPESPSVEEAAQTSEKPAEPEKKKTPRKRAKAKKSQPAEAKKAEAA